jgi:hypothetical protein
MVYIITVLMLASNPSTNSILYTGVGIILYAIHSKIRRLKRKCKLVLYAKVLGDYQSHKNQRLNQMVRRPWAIVPPATVKGT